jgi:endonuclease-8
MPEGPTIRNTADRLREALEGRRVERFQSSFKKAAREEWAARIEGQLVTAVRAHGKNLFIHFANGWTLYSHMLMWGSWHIYGHGEQWVKEARKARAVLETAEHVLVLFSAPICELIHPDDLAAHKTSELGPDLLDPDFDAATAAEIRRRLVAQGETQVGAAIMNQTVMAGIGNILKSEILFRSGINPLRRADSLSDAEFTRLLDVSRDFMLRSYETHGFKQVFLPTQLQAALGKLGYVYGRSKQPCMQCGSTIQMVRQGHGDRMTFFCPFCQPLDPAQPGEREERPVLQTPWTNTVKTIEQARDFVLARGMIGILEDAKGKLPTLWDAVDAPDKQPGEGGWGEKMSKVWNWKNELVARYPDEIFYGKIRGGRAVLMSMAQLRAYYPQQHKPLEQCSSLAQQLFEVIEGGPIATVPLRRAVGMWARSERSKFDRALQELQVTLNIARSSAPGLEQDTWVPFLQQYPELAS